MGKLIQTLLLATLLPSFGLAQALVLRTFEAAISVAEDPDYYTYYHTRRPEIPRNADVDARARHQLELDQWESERFAAQERILAQEIKFLAEVESRGAIHTILRPRIRIGDTEYAFHGGGQEACLLFGKSIGKEFMRSVATDLARSSDGTANLYQNEGVVYLHILTEYESIIEAISQIICVE